MAGSELSVDVGVAVTGEYTVKNNGEVLIFGSGEQTATVSEGVRQFTVKNMGAGDKIVLPENLRDKNIFAYSGSIKIDTLIILGVGRVDSHAKVWVDKGGNTFAYCSVTTLGVHSNGTGLTYVGSRTETEISRISGLQTSDGIRVSSDKTISIPMSSVVEGSNVELSGSYSYFTGITLGTYTKNENGTKLTYSAGSDGTESIKVTGAAVQPTIERVQENYTLSSGGGVHERHNSDACENGLHRH